LHQKFASTNHFILAKNFEEEVNNLVKIEEKKQLTIKEWALYI
jgi:hypothetical protein